MGRDSKQATDGEIVGRIIQGEVNAFEVLLQRHKGRVLEIVKKHIPSRDLEETVQDVFVRAYRSLSTFKARGSFEHWLSAISVRTCYDYWRKAYRSREVPMSALTDKHREWLAGVLSDDPTRSDERKGTRREAREVLDWALGRLSAEDRMVLELVHLEERSVRETADLLGWSVANVKVRSFRSRRKLKGLILGLEKG